MKNNKATWVFLATLAILFVVSALRLRTVLGTPIFPLLVFVFGLYSSIQFFEWVCNLASTSKWFSVLPILKQFTVGGQVPFWHRQIIFFGGFGLGYICLQLAS